MTIQLHCPACSGVLVSEPPGAPLSCRGCDWRLLTLEEWHRLSPFEQGYVHYTQSAWPTSPLAKEKNHHANGTPAWAEFCRGEQCAVQDAQDGEE